MKRKKNYSLLKHIDFLIIDLICIQICFFCACMVRKDTFLDSMDRYMFMAGILLILFVIVTYKILIKPELDFFENPLPFAKEDAGWERTVRKQLILLIIVALCYETYFCLSPNIDRNNSLRTFTISGTVF